MTDVILVGGGLANGLAALALRARHRRLRLTLVEAQPTLGGNHTWSFHGTDVDDRGAALLEPLVEWRWPAVRVAFPSFERRLATPYASFTSAALDRAVRGALAVPGSEVIAARAVEVGPAGVVLADGRHLRAPLVLDARGPAAPVTHAEGTAYQKFVGLELDVDRSWPLDEPMLMDARVPQFDGFRFLYVLPLGPRHLLVEDTSFSDGPALDRGQRRALIEHHLERHGVGVTRVRREEEGCLPLPLEPRGIPPLGSPLRLGYQGGWIHPTTGYSLPIAVRVALALGDDPRPEALVPLWRQLHQAQTFSLRLNRLLFRAVPPDQRRAVMARFYQLPAATIERFYALASTAADRARILCGRPPGGVSLRSALRVAQGA